MRELSGSDEGAWRVVGDFGTLTGGEVNGLGVL